LIVAPDTLAFGLSGRRGRRIRRRRRLRAGDRQFAIEFDPQATYPNEKNLEAKWGSPATVFEGSTSGAVLAGRKGQES
jgi:hypothetical protein